MKVAGIINLVHYARQKSGYAGAYIFLVGLQEVLYTL